MTVILLEALETILGGTGPVNGTVTARYWAGTGPVIRVEGEKVIFPGTVRVRICDGEPVQILDLPATDGTVCVQWVIESEGRRFRRYTTVPDTGPVPFGGLPVVDPASFIPVDPTPTLVELIDQRIEQHSKTSDITIDPDNPDVLLVTTGGAINPDPDNSDVLVVTL